jgi:molybdopterin molybdotransferase
MTDSQKTIPVQPSCENDAGRQPLAIEAVWQRIRTDVKPIRGSEHINVRRAQGRILAEDIRSPLNVPGNDNSAMDGYALRGADLPREGTREFRLVGTVLAGQQFNAPVGPGECVRIMTGAPIPNGADTVVMQENVLREDDRIHVGSKEKAGQNVRPAGEDLALGELALPAGRRIGPAELGILGSLGLVEVAVKRRIRVAYFSTGDELRSAGSQLEAGQIYDSNRYTLHAVLERLGVEATDMGVIPDDPTSLKQAFTDAASFADAIISSGGVSVGEADYVNGILAELGAVNFWQIAMRPGRPLAFGTIGHAYFFGMPGNPVSVVATWYAFVQPALRQLMGQQLQKPLSFRVRSTSALKKRPGRTEFQRGVLERDASGELVVHSTGSQGSGMLNSVSRANCFIVLPHEGGPVATGDYVEVQPFEGIMGL